MLGIVIAVGLGCMVLERLWPAVGLPKVRAWWARVVLINLVQLGIVILAGHAWNRWLEHASLFHLRQSLGPWSQGTVAYVVSTFVYYWWHRYRHESDFFWRLCHQLHHAPRRLEVVTSFYKHPVEITINSVLSALIVFTLLGCDPAGAAVYTLMVGCGEFFYHTNVRTPHWVGELFQRPEQHRIHHKYGYHTNNYADLPIWDRLFGTFENPTYFESNCGFDSWREDRLEDMLAFRDVHAPEAASLSPLHLLPTCIGCSKRWDCAELRGVTAAPEPTSPE